MDVRLSDEELAAVVRRAHEITSLQGRLEEGRNSLDEYVRAAEEMGVPREAMMQALHERFAFLERDVEPGTLVFALSGDGRHYAAKVLKCDGDSLAVRFLNGGEGVVGRHQLQEPSFSPGSEYEYHSPSYMMYLKAQAVRYDRDALTVTFNYWGTEETVPLAKVRTVKPRSGIGPPPWVYTLAIALGSGVLGAVLALVLRGL
jgi:hypothetical protein